MAIQFNKKILWAAIVLFIQFVVVKLPPIGKMTPLGMHVLFILIGSIIGWIFIDLGWPSLTGIIALGFSGAFSNMGACIAACLGSQLTWMIVGATFVCGLIESTGLANVIVGFLLNLKIAKRSPYLMSFFFFLAGFLVSAVSHCLVAIMLFISLYRGLAEKAEIPQGAFVNSYWLCGTALSIVGGMMYLPYRVNAIIIGNMYTSVTNMPFSSLHWIICGMGGGVLTIVVYILFCRYFLHVDLSAFDPNMLSIEKIKATKEQKVSLVFLVIMVLALVIPSTFAKSTFPLFVRLNYLGNGGIMLALLGIMMIWSVNGTALLNLEKVKFSWNVLWMAAFYSTLAGFLSSEEAGISESLSAVFAPMLEKIPSVVFVILAIYFSMIASQFLNNLVVALVFISAITALSGSISGINLAAALMAIFISSNSVSAMPSANPVNAITFSNSDLITFKNESKIGWLSNFAMATFCIGLYFIMAIYFDLFGMV